MCTTVIFYFKYQRTLKKKLLPRNLLGIMICIIDGKNKTLDKLLTKIYVLPCCTMQAFQAAWADACKVEAATMIVPSGYKFLVGPISFSGPYCQRNILFQVNM